VKVIDFGFARELSLKMTSKKGTYYYMAPQVEGNEDHYYPREVDLYSLGVTLYQMAFN